MVTSVPRDDAAAFHARLASDCAALGFQPSDAQLNAQLTLLNHLLHWNALINISAVTAPEEMMKVHIVDSLAALPVVLSFIERATNPKILDVGTGPGLPALPWALALAETVPTTQIVAIDAVRKKIDTINDFIAKQKLTNISAQHARIEDVKGEFDVVTSRAFSSLKNFVTLAGARVRGGGVMLALKGKTPDDEIAELSSTKWEVAKMTKLTVPRLGAERCVLELRRKG
jgi:16S rRNA (guanine527-N7)-methyltransferase